MTFYDLQGKEIPGITCDDARRADLDGDRVDDLHWLSEGTLCAYRGRTDNLMWEWAIPGGMGRIWPATGSSLEVTIIANTIYTLDGVTGKVRWLCGGPGNLVGFLPHSDARQLPRVLYRSTGVSETICRQAIDPSSLGSGP